MVPWEIAAFRSHECLLLIAYRHEFVRKPKRIQTLAGVKIVQVTIGGWHCLAVDADGQAYAWGGNEYGQCALPTDEKDILVRLRCGSQPAVSSP